MSQLSIYAAVDGRYKLGVVAARDGRKDEAKRLFLDLVDASYTNRYPDIWLWLARVTDNPEEKRFYFERALWRDPDLIEARLGLAVLRGEVAPHEILTPGATPQPVIQPQPEAARLSVFQCQTCAGFLRFDPTLQVLHCNRCGCDTSVESHNAANDERDLALALPTTRAHLWANVYHHVLCTQCGADSILSPSELTARCPFCGSTALADSHVLSVLLEPQAIAPMRYTAHEVEALALAWLEEQLGASHQEVQDLHFYGAYYPFWTFDTRCVVGWDDHRPYLVLKRQYRDLVYDDILISGTKKVPTRLAQTIEPFDLKEVVAFRPEFLAGWSALTYDQPLSAAFIEARRLVVEQLKPVFDKYRHASYATSGFNDVTYKQLLLPIWRANYFYRGQLFSLLVNGRTGQIGSEQMPAASINQAPSPMRQGSWLHNLLRRGA